MMRFIAVAGILALAAVGCGSTSQSQSTARQPSAPAPRPTALLRWACTVTAGTYDVPGSDVRLRLTNPSATSYYITALSVQLLDSQGDVLYTLVGDATMGGVQQLNMPAHTYRFINDSDFGDNSQYTQCRVQSWTGHAVSGGG